MSFANDGVLMGRVDLPHHLVQIVAKDGTPIAVAEAIVQDVPGWYPSVECIAGMISEEA